MTDNPPVLAAKQKDGSFSFTSSLVRAPKCLAGFHLVMDDSGLLPSATLPPWNLESASGESGQLRTGGDSLHILAAGRSHVTTPSCKGIWVM